MHIPRIVICIRIPQRLRDQDLEIPHPTTRKLNGWLLYSQFLVICSGTRYSGHYVPCFALKRDQQIRKHIQLTFSGLGQETARPKQWFKNKILPTKLSVIIKEQSQKNRRAFLKSSVKCPGNVAYSHVSLNLEITSLTKSKTGADQHMAEALKY